MSTRPEFKEIASSKEFRRWYWQKDELVLICKQLDIPYTAGKFELIDRIAHSLDGKEYKRAQSAKATSHFDWAKEKLTKQTVITDNYKNNQNVRTFFQSHIQGKFSFSIDLMNWMRENQGRTLGDALDFYQQLSDKKAAGYRQAIPKHNQYNAYIRAFMEDNPSRTLEEAKKYWQWKRSQPSNDGRHRYSRSDLKQ